MYNHLIIGSGLYGATLAHELKKQGKKVLVIDKRPHIGGNIYTEEIEGIQVHKYGAHIFHTSNKEVWDYIQQFALFNRYTNSPIARYGEEVYNMPFNMNTFQAMWGINTPKEVEEKIQEQVVKENIKDPKNLEEQALSLVGRDIYEKLIKGYTEKQWGKKATELPAFIIKRLPVRLVFDNNYFNDNYQGIPVGGYTKLIENMLDGIEVQLNTDFFSKKEYFEGLAEKVIFTGMIDEYFNYCYGELEYRSLEFQSEILEEENHQGNAVVNYTAYEIPYTRVIEHKHFELRCQGNQQINKTVITKEYPKEWKKGDEPYYSVNDEKNNRLFMQYQELAKKQSKVIFGGRLGLYQYFDMHHVIEEALKLAKSL